MRYKLILKNTSSLINELTRQELISLLSVEVSEFKQQQESDLKIEVIDIRVTCSVRLIRVSEINNDMIELKTIINKDANTVQINSLKSLRSD